MKKNNLFKFAILLLTSFNAFIFAEKDIEIPEIKFDKFILDNGLTVVVHEDRKVPMVAVNVWYHVGSKNEVEGKTGFAHLFEHLMFNGTENYNNEFFEPFEKVGSTDQNGTTNSDRTNYFQNVPTNALDLALWMESERMGHILGVIDQEKLDEQRGVVQNEKRQGENQPYGKTWITIAKSAFPKGHPYSWSTIGSMEDLNAASMDDVRNWFKTYYGPNNAVLVLAGDINLETAKEKVEKFFGDIPAGPTLTKPKRWIAKRADSKREIMFDNVPQTRIYKVWNVPEDGTREAEALSLAAASLSSGKNSPMYQELVYKTSLATSAGAYYYGREIAGLFVMYADVSPGGDAAEVEKVMDNTLADFLRKGPNATALKNIRTEVVSGLIFGLQRIGGFGGKSDILATYETFYDDPGAYKDIYEMYMSIPRTEIKNISKDWLSSGEYTLLIQPEEKRSIVESSVDRSKGVPYPSSSSVQDIIDNLGKSFPNIEKRTLNNGAELYVAERNDLPIVELEIMFDGGYAIESDETLGFVNFTMSMMDEGTEKYNALEFDEKESSLGAGIGFGSSLDTTYASLSSLKANISDSLKLFKEGLLNPIFPEVEIERTKKQWLASIDQSLNNPSAMANMAIRPIIFGSDHPYGKASSMGTKKTISSLKRENLMEMHKVLTNPANASIIVVGDISVDEAEKLLNTEFQNWNSYENKININLPEVSSPQNSRVYLLNKPNAVQSYILAGQLLPPTNSGDDIVIDYMNYAIAGSFTSRLNMNLREDKSWSYGVRTGTGSGKGQRLMLMRAPVQTDKTIPAIQEILREYNEYISTNPITNDELEKIKNSRLQRMPSQYETLGSLLGAIENIIKYDRGFDYLGKLAAARENISLQEVRDASLTYIKPNTWTWVIVGDLSKIQQDIEALEIGNVEVIEL